MSVKIFIGKQVTEGTAAASLIDLGATDFSGGENYNSVKSEAFNTFQAEGDQFLVGIDVALDTPIEWNAKTLEYIMSGLGYVKEAEQTEYKLSSAEPSSYTILVSDSTNNKKTVYKDCKPGSISINASKGAIVNGSISWLGKTAVFENGTVIESGPSSRGESLVALNSIIKLGGTAITEEVESVTLEINNNLEAKGSINSVYTNKIKRTAPQSTTSNLEFNSYDQARFETLKAKAIANNSENLEINLLDQDKVIKILVPKLFITTSSRGDYKGAGSHSLSMTASANNSDRTPAKFSFNVPSRFNLKK